MPRQLWTFNLPSIDYDESAREACSARFDGQDRTRYLQIDGADVEEFTQSILGYSTFIPGINLLQRSPPEAHPRMPWLVARAVEFVRELGEPGQDPVTENSLVFDSVEMAVRYERTEETAGINFAYDFARPVAAGISELWRYVHRRRETEIHAVPLPRNVLEFVAPNGAGGHDPVPEPGVQMQPEATWYYRFLEVPVIAGPNGAPLLPGSLEANIGRIEGTVNAASFDDDLHAPLTLLCLPHKRQLRTMADGNLCFDLTYIFAKRGSLDVSGAGFNTTGTATADFTRILQANGMYWKVRRKATPAASIYAATAFDYLFRFDAMP